MIKLENITFKYDKTIINDINLNIQKSKVTFIIGANGSGKSTLANIISGLLYPVSGKLSIDDIVINKKTDNKLIRNKVGIVFQNPSNQIIFSKVYDDIKFTLENMKVEKTLIPEIIKDSLKKVNMENFMNTNPYELSGGEQQRIAIASQLSLNPDYLIFDEATSMIDINGKQAIYKLINLLKKKMGIIFITNNMDELNQVIKRNIPDRVRTNWSEEVRANWQRYYSDSVPMAMESMKASAVNLRTAVDEAIRYSKQ